MDPRHDPRRIRAAKEAARLAREDQRAALVRRENATLLETVEGTICAEALGGSPDLDLCLLALVKDYMSRGLRLSPSLREILSRLLAGEGVGPGEEREAVLEMLGGAVGLLPKSGKSLAYLLMERREVYLSFSADDASWKKVEDLLDQALRRGAYKFFADFSRIPY